MRGRRRSSCVCSLRNADVSLLHRERAAQDVVASQGLPAPRVLAADETGDVVGRVFILMERLPGHPLLGGVEFPRNLVEGVRILGHLPRIVVEGVRIVSHLPRIMAEMQAKLHALDPEPLLRALEGQGISREAAGAERWLGEIERSIEQWSLQGLRPGLRWLVANRPPNPARLSICHGDFWAGNILVDGNRVTGVLDWSRVTVGDPACDVGGTYAAYQMAPIRAPAPVQLVVTQIGRNLARRFYARYRKLREVNETAVRYYAAMCALIELQFLLAARAKEAATGIRANVVPVWQPSQLAAYFRKATGVVVWGPEVPHLG